MISIYFLVSKTSLTLLTENMKPNLIALNTLFQKNVIKVVAKRKKLDFIKTFSESDEEKY